MFGVKNAMFVITGFHENVKRRELMSNEQPENVVLEVTPRDHQHMLVPCVWDRWEQDGEILYSFALITYEPPPTVAGAGPDRCPINLTRSAAEVWLSPKGQDNAELLKLLEDRQRPYELQDSCSQPCCSAGVPTNFGETY